MTTPTCPNCGAKFSHDNTSSQCKSCGIPDEIVDAGPDAITLYRKRQEKLSGIPRRQIKALKRHERTHQGTQNKNKHGRKGVKR